MIDESVIRTVIERTDIVRLVKEYVPLRAKSGRLWGCCPFHHEKTPSFTVNPDRGIYYCFGCHEGGNAAKFLMKMEGVAFPEAIERLAERLGIEIKPIDEKTAGARNAEKAHRLSLFEINRTAMAYFEQSFAGPEGKACREYAESRGIPEDIRKLFHLCYAPESWDGLIDALIKANASLEDARALGLIAARNEGNGYYARFRNRFMFPVMNVRGDIIAFSGRTLDSGEVAKYINSPESAVYTKGEHLFGLCQAKNHIAREHCAILVEGNVDAVMMHSYGFCHTVASLGTALTPKQADLLYRHAKTVYLMYDGDEAGQKSMMRALPILLARGFEGLFAVGLPREDDPDSFLKVYGAEGMKALIDNAQPLGAWCIGRKCEQILSVAPEFRKKGFAELSDIIGGFGDSLAQHHYIGEAARLLGTDARKLAAELGYNFDADAAARRNPNAAADGKAGTDRPVGIEAIVAQMVVGGDKRCASFFESQLIDLIQDAGLRNLLIEFSKLEDRSEYAIEHSLSPEALEQYYRLACSKAEAPKDERGKDLWYEGALAALFLAWANQERYRIAEEIAACVKARDEAGAEELLKRDRALLDVIQNSFKERRFFQGETAGANEALKSEKT